MHRALFVGTLLGASLLGAACNESNNPAQSSFIPRPEYQNREPEGLTSRLTGFSVDPEAYFINLALCAPPGQCQMPPLYAEFSPLLQRALVRNVPVTLTDTLPDPATGQPPPPPPPTVSNAAGLWTVEKFPTRRGPPFLVLSPANQGTLANDVPVPMPPVPVGNYLTTVSVRPVVPAHSACVGLEALQMSDNGIMDAVARRLSAEGPAVTVADLINPARYGGVTVFWFYRPGFPVFRVPADSTTVEATSGRVLNVEWAPPGALQPTPLAPFQSPRGFFIPPGPPAPSSSIGVVAVVHPAFPPGPPPVVTYTVKDTKSDVAGGPVEGRPWLFPQPLQLPVIPGVVALGGLQLASKLPSTTPQLPPPSTCIPGQ
jgi:hypothetical protein